MLIVILVPCTLTPTQHTYAIHTCISGGEDVTSSAKPLGGSDDGVSISWYKNTVLGTHCVWQY